MLPTAEWNVPELDIMNHKELERWLASATPRQMWQAIFAGREWLANFEPETEDDETLIEAVKERLEMIEAAYELVEGSGMEAQE
jgi:hypothetical protein